MDRSIPDNVMDARAGAWNKALYGKASGVKGKTLGVIGLGNIGRAVVKRALALEMKIVAWSRSLTSDQADTMGITAAASPLEVAAASDIVTLHVASTPDTKNLADAAFFDAMKPGAFFINTTRAAVVDDAALVTAMEKKGIRAALDVFSGEPSFKEGAFEHPLAARRDVYLTHHIGASTLQAQEAIAEEAVRVILEYVGTGNVENCVNMADVTPATHQLTVRHLNKVGVLAAVLDEVQRANWNVQEMENLVFSKAHAACATIRFDGSASTDVLDKINALPDVLATNMINL
jgi:D-3-phosphoglycerate dehydrogenase / 2-oxoglutarate reductase